MRLILSYLILRFGWRWGRLRQKLAAICECDFWCSHVRLQTGGPKREWDCGLQKVELISIACELRLNYQKRAGDPRPSHTRQRYEQKSGQNMTPKCFKTRQTRQFWSHIFVHIFCLVCGGWELQNDSPLNALLGMEFRFLKEQFQWFWFRFWCRCWAILQ